MSEIEYEFQMIADHVDESKEAEATAQMIDAVNCATERARQREESAQIAARMSEALYAAERNQKRADLTVRRHIRRKHKAVMRIVKIMMAVAAVYGFECLMGLPRELTLASMIIMLLLALYIFAAQVIPEVMWYLRHKAVMAR